MAGILMAGSPINRVLFLEDTSDSLGSQDTDTNMECSPQKTIASITKTPVSSDNISNKGSPDVIVYATEDSVRRQLYQFPGRKPHYVDVVAKDMSTLAESIKYIVDDAKSSKTCVAEMRQQLKQVNRELKDLQDQREGILNAMNEAIEEADNLKDTNRELLNTNASLAQEKNQALSMLTALNEELGNMKGEVSTLKTQLDVWTAAPAVLESALPDFLRRTSDRMQANANAVREAAIRREALAAAQQTETQANNEGGACVICYERTANMMSDICHRITACKSCCEHMIVCPHCDQQTTFTEVFFEV